MLGADKSNQTIAADNGMFSFTENDHCKNWKRYPQKD
jgi:hypothetical protein